MGMRLNPRRWLPCLLGGVALLLPSCTGDGQICLFGYTSRPNYDTRFKTVYVPIFKNLSFRRGIEFDLTRAVIREIESKTPYKVVSNASQADTELTGTVVSLNKNVINVNPLNEVREAETVLTVLVAWRDLRTGQILSQPRKAGELPPQPLNLPPGAPLPPPPLVTVQSTGNYIPELGGTLITAQQQNIDRLAIQIVSMMEIGW
jgi:hypothetical protein